MKTLQWRHKCAWNHLRLNCFCNRLFRRRSKKTWKLCVDSPLKGPVTRKMIPFHDVIMNAMDLCRCETMTPYILTPESIYHTIFWHLHDILTYSASNSFVCYVQLLNVVYCYCIVCVAHAWESNTNFKFLPKYHLLHPIETEILMDFQHMDLMNVLWKSMWYLEATNVSFYNELIDLYWFYSRVLVSGKGELDHDLSLIPRDCSPCGLKCENVLHWINPLPPFGARDTPPVNHGNRYARWARLSTKQRTTADRWRPPWDRDKTIGDSQIQITWWT